MSVFCPWWQLVYVLSLSFVSTLKSFVAFSPAGVRDSGGCVVLGCHASKPGHLHTTFSKQHLKSAALWTTWQVFWQGMTVNHSFSGIWSLLQCSVKVRFLYPVSLPSNICGKTWTLAWTSRNGWESWFNLAHCFEGTYGLMILCCFCELPFYIFLFFPHKSIAYII